MDRNSIIGIVLIFLVLVVFSIMNKPSQEQIDAMRNRQDSLQQVEIERERQAQLQQQNETATIDLLPDSVMMANKQRELESQLGVFGTAANGEESFITFENNLVKLTLSNKGGRIYSVELKNYKTYDGRPLLLFDGPKNQFGLNFFAQNRNIQTDQLFFTTQAPGSSSVSGPEVRKGDLGDEKFNE